MNFEKSPHPAFKIASVGGFGHGICVFRELAEQAHSAPSVQLVGMAPAYIGEAIDDFLADPWVRQSGAPTFHDLTSLLAETTPDVLVVSTRPDQIPVCAEAGMRAGCHLIVEKPVALSRNRVAELEALAKAEKVRVMAQLSMRALPAFRAAREAVRNGRIGKVILVNARKSYRWGTRPGWFGKRAHYGGTWPWVGIHTLDMTHYVTGLRAISVTATHANLAHPELPGCEDCCSGWFVLKGGALLSASIDLCRPESAPSHGDDWIRVVGDAGIVEANASKGICELIEKGKPPRLLPVSPGEAPIYGAFLHSLRKPRDRFDATAFHLTRAALAARDAADSGQKIILKETSAD